MSDVWDRISKRQQIVEENEGIRTEPVSPAEYGRLVVAVQELSVIVAELQDKLKRTE
jgi:hypothetical protein